MSDIVAEDSNPTYLKIIEILNKHQMLIKPTYPFPIVGCFCGVKFVGVKDGDSHKHYHAHLAAHLMSLPFGGSNNIIKQLKSIIEEYEGS